ncbi:MAG TPA: tetratricopeptide repeat protein, partial [Thermoanaerobaculia bacterium]
MRISLFLAILCALAVAGGADEARSLLANGEAAKAAEAARALAEKDPANVDAWLVLADALFRQDDPEGAQDAVETGLKRNADDVRLQLKLSEVFIKLAEKEQRGSRDGMTIRNYYLDAERVCDEVLQKNPKSAAAVCGKAYANFYLDQKEQARKYVSDCLAIDKDYGRAHALQAYMFYQDKKYAEAQRVYEVALKLDTSDVFDFVRYGHCFVGQGKMAEAKAAYIEGLRHHPRDATPILSGLLNLVKKDYRQSVPSLQEAVTKVPESPHAWFYLGYGHFQNNAFGDALKAFEKALALDPGRPQYVYYCGWALEQQGDAAKALDRYREVLKAAPGDADAAARFEGVIRMNRDIATLEKLYEELIVLAPTYGWGQNNYALTLRDWAEQRGAATNDKPPADVLRRLKRSGEVYEMAAENLPEEPQVQSDTALLYEYYPANRDDAKALQYFAAALDKSECTYRDAFDGLERLCRRT